MAPDVPTVPARLRRNRERAGDRPAVVTLDASVTWTELDDRSRAMARRLVAAGVNAGDRIGLRAPNGIDWVVHALAVTRVGATLVPLSTLLRPPELRAQLLTAAVGRLLTVDGLRNRRLADEVPDLPSLRSVWLLDGVPDAAAPDDLVQAMEDRVRPADDLVVLFTSGSRGEPKGVVHTHGGAIRATAAGLPARCIGPDERLYIPMPFFWTGGFAGGLVSTLVAGSTLLTEAIPEPGATLELLERERATLFRGWPDQAARLAEHPDFATADLSSLGDGSLPAVLPAERRPAPGARANLFGMTETFGPYCGAALDRDLPPAAHGSCGMPFDGIEVQIVDPATGREVPAGTEGEIRVRGPNLMRAICGREDRDVFTADGFHPTGDLGRFDGDGYLWFHGRLDDMFKVRGASVHPAEVEAALRGLAAVRAAHVTDVDGPDGPEVGALVVTSASLDELLDEVSAVLSAFKVPTRWRLTDDPATVPLLASGKVDTAALRRVLGEGGG